MLYNRATHRRCRHVMAPRPYQSSQRQAGGEQTRSRIIIAARDLLSGSGGLPGFTIDAVARQAGVARMTVYYQFGSKLGLLEALFDSLSIRLGAERLYEALRRPTARAALLDFIVVFGQLWEADRLIIRRLQGL